MSAILAIDPGTTRSAWLLLESEPPGMPIAFGLEDNDVVLRRLRRHDPSADVVVVEEVRSFMRRVGREVFETVRWAGRFEEAAHPTPVVLLGRKDVVVRLCGSAAANDADVRLALLDRFGGSAAIGRKAAPGPLYGIHRDVWSALAIAVTYDIGRVVDG